jgi:cell division protein FtsW
MKNSIDKPRGHIDWYILLPVIALMLYSIAFVYSASSTIAEKRFNSAESLFIKHSIRVLLGIITIIIFSKIDYHKLKKVTKPLLFFSIILLIVVLFLEPVNQVTRWINFGPLSFQPSEFAKFAMVLHFAYLLEKKQAVIKDFREGYLPFLLWIGLMCLLIAIQPNFSTTIVIYLIALSMLFIGNANLLHIITTGLSSIGIAIIYLIVTADYRLDRLLSFMGNSSIKETVNHKANYQLDQALIAIGNGGIFGVGPGQSRQSHLFLPESYGDFIYSIIGEEYGFIGVTLILVAFILIFWRGMLIAKKAPDNFGYFLAVGILITFAIYVFVNAGVNCGLLPTTGLPMPFISYGGTAVIFYSAAIGILLNISAQAGVYPRRLKE